MAAVAEATAATVVDFGVVVLDNWERGQPGPHVSYRLMKYDKNSQLFSDRFVVPTFILADKKKTQFSKFENF